MGSDANSVGVSYIEEVTYGVTPSGNLKQMRITSDGLGQDHTTIRSAEIRSDRQVADIKRVDARAAGAINVELSYGALDDMLTYALLSAAFAGTASVTGTIYSMASGDNSLNRSSGDFVAGGFLLYSWIRVSGFANAANNKYFKITAITTTKLTLSGGTVVTESAGPTVTVKQGDSIKNGVTLKSTSIERVYTDLSNEFVAYRGCCVDQFALNVALGQINTGVVTFLGKSEQSATATIGTGYTAAPSNDIMNAVDEVNTILENQAAVLEVQSFGIQLQNNLRTRLQIGTLGAISIGKGEIGLTGTFRQLFSTKAMMDKYLNQTPTNFAIVFRDVANNAIVFDLPRVKFTSGRRVAGGANTDIIADMAFEAYREPTENTTIRIMRIAA